MGHFLDAAFKVLLEIGKPLSSKEITNIAIERGWLRTHGKTPYHTMKAKLSTDILKHKENSVFMRTDKACFGLRQWRGRFQEYVADRYQKALLDEEIMVFPAKSLGTYLYGAGLHTIHLKNGISLIAECYPMQRRMAEEDFSVIQLVSVFILRWGKYYLTYKRTKRLPESRLHGFYSMVFGGHLSPQDVPSLFNIFKPGNEEFIKRELFEEVRFSSENFPEISYKGLLYDDGRPISKQHLGIVFDVHLRSQSYEIGERGFLIDSKFETIEQIESRIADFENWSVLVLMHEKKSLSLNRDMDEFK